jgi:hypothetical protein
MTKHILVSAAALGLLAGIPHHAAAAEDLATQLVGVWTVTSFAVKELATGATIMPWGGKPVGQWIFTRGGHFAWSQVAEGRKAPAGLTTDADRAALYNSAGFGSGTWRVEGTTVSLQYSTSMNQVWTGTERRNQPTVSGKTLTWPSAPYKAQGGEFAGKEVMAIATLERVE